MEAGYVAACEAAKETTWLRKFLHDMKVVPYLGNTMDTTHFVFDTNTMIQRVHVVDMRVKVSYAIRLHKTRPRNSNH